MKKPEEIPTQLGITSEEAYTHFAGPGGIVKRLEGQQWGLPANDNASPQAHISRDTHGLPNG
jgi:hypothetical protein